MIEDYVIKLIHNISTLIYYNIDLTKIDESNVLEFLLNNSINNYSSIRLLTRFFFLNLKRLFI